MFEEQDAEYKEAVLPAAVKARVSVEAGVAMRGTSTSLLRQAGFHRAVRPAGRRCSEHDRPGITAEHVVEAAKASIAESKPPSDSTGRGMMHVPLPFYRTINKDLIQKGIKEKNND